MYYQPLTVADYFNRPAIYARDTANLTQTIDYESESIEYKYNSLGYRTYEFTDIKQPYAVAFGASHTDGVGLHEENRWTSQVEKLLGYQVYTLGINGCDSKIVLQNLLNWITSDLPKPTVVLIHWPPIFRTFIWENSVGVNLLPSEPHYIFNDLLKAGEENFWVNQVNNILLGNAICKGVGISPIHLMFDNHDECMPQIKKILHSANIELHLDEKLPEKTWLYDSAAADKLHHSSACHKQWAERIYKIIKEKTQ